MSDSTGSAFRYFLIEYKKRLPENEENKDFHKHIDFMIKCFEYPDLYYRRDYGEHVSLNDERYWRNPNEKEKSEMRKREIEMNNEKKLSFIERLIGFR
jgi:hypothetical protein